MGLNTQMPSKLSVVLSIEDFYPYAETKYDQADLKTTVFDSANWLSEPTCYTVYLSIDTASPSSLNIMHRDSRREDLFANIPTQTDSELFSNYMIGM